MIISLSNQKGGVGKTTSAINMAACMTRMGHKVLVVDLDPQENLTTAWGVDKKAGNVFDVLVGELRISDAMVELASKVTEAKGRLSIIPGSSSMARFEKLRAGEVNAQFDLKKVLSKVEKDFDYILLDCPPALGLITINALSCTNYVVVPMEAQLFALEGLEGISDTIKQIQEFSNPKLKLGGIFFIRHDKRKVLNRTVESFIAQNFEGTLLPTAIRENVALKEAPHQEQDIFTYDPTSNGAQDYESLTKELIARLCKKGRNR